MIGKILNKLDKKYAFGLLTGLIFGLLGIYTDFFKSNNPDIQFDILSNTTVIDLKEHIGKIDIFYDSMSILSNKQNLSLITVKVSNVGNTDVLNNFYDRRFPLGIRIEKGTILEKPILIQASNRYLSESIGLTTDNKSSIRFSDFIFEKDEFFILKILVLHEIGAQPEILPEGKVAGVKKLNVVKSYVSKEDKSFWLKVIDGTIIIHITRFFTYVFSIILFVLCVGMPINFIVNHFTSKKRRKKLHKLKTEIGRDFTNGEKKIAEYYKRNGYDSLTHLKGILTQGKKYKKYFDDVNYSMEEDILIRHAHGAFDSEPFFLIKTLIKEKYITIKDDEILIDEKINGFIDQLIEFLPER